MKLNESALQQNWPTPNSRLQHDITWRPVVQVLMASDRVLVELGWVKLGYWWVLVPIYEEWASFSLRKT